MRIYKHKGWPVVESTWLINLINKNARGMAPFWFVLIREPILTTQTGMFNTGEPLESAVCSSTGCKPTEHVLDHEVDHLERYKKIGRLKAMYLLLTDKDFREEDEKHAKEAE